jgi:DNA-binding FadR family transcriptional regulator
MEQFDGTLNKLRQMIAAGALAAGGRIPPERTLAVKLGIGRRSLRRALGVLEQEGRISRHQGRGTFVQSNGRPAAAPERPNPALAAILDHTNPLEVIEVRLAVEPVMARLAAFRASQAEIKRLQALAEATRTAADPDSYERADASFHRSIAEAARNSLGLAIFDTLHASQRDVGWRRLGENAHCYKRQSVYADFHRDISAAIAARQGDRAQELMHRHLSDVQQHIYRHAFPAAAAQ